MKDHSHSRFHQTIEINYEKMHNWKEHILFTWQWWVGVSLIVVLIALWIIFHKKESRHRLLYAGFFVAIISSVFDSTGSFFGLWELKYEVLPISNSFVPRSLIILPIVAMFFLQIKPNIHPLIKAFLYAVFTSFVALPLFQLIGFYHPIHWHYIYSFFIQFFIYLGAYALSRKTHFSSLFSEKKDA